MNFIVKRTLKSSEEIVHIDRLTKYKNAVPSQWRKEVEREKEESSRVQTELDEAAGTPLEGSVEGRVLMEPPEEPCASTQELPLEILGDSDELCGVQLPNNGQLKPEEDDIRSDGESDAWEERDQLISHVPPQLVGNVPNWTCASKQERVNKPVGETTELYRGENGDSRDVETQDELRREWEDRPIFSGVTKDDDPDVTPTQTFVQRKRTPLLEPIMESSELPRPQRHRRQPPWLKDYKLRRIKRIRYLQLCSPTDENCSKTLGEASEPTLRVSILRCNMTR